MGENGRTKQLAKNIVSRLKKESFRSTTEVIGVSYGELRDCLIHVVDPFLYHLKDYFERSSRIKSKILSTPRVD